MNVTSAIFARLDPQFLPHKWTGTYAEVLPHIQHAFHDVITDLSAAIDPLVRNDITMLIKEMCNPDLAKRGHRKGLGSGSQYSLERYKSHTDLILKRTSASVRARKVA